MSRRIKLFLNREGNRGKTEVPRCTLLFMMFIFYTQKMLILHSDRHLLQQTELPKLLMASAFHRIKSTEMAESSKGSLPDKMPNRTSSYPTFLFPFSSATQYDCRNLLTYFTNKSIHKVSSAWSVHHARIKMHLSTLNIFLKKITLTVEKRGKYAFLQGVFSHWVKSKKALPHLANIQKTQTHPTMKINVIKPAQFLIYNNRQCPQPIFFFFFFLQNHHSWWILKDYVRI